MSGHSKWSSIKHKKGAADAKRGREFTKLSRAISVAVREGGPDPGTNLALQNAIEKARHASMPKDNIERSIARASGEGADAAAYETVAYEGYGPGGIAVYVEALTDNRNRTASDVRHMFSKNEGNLGESGSVAWLFERKGVVTGAGRRRRRGRADDGGRRRGRRGRRAGRDELPDRDRAGRARDRAAGAGGRGLRDRGRAADDAPEDDGADRGREPSRARSCACWTGSRRTTTSRASTRTSTSPSSCSKPPPPSERRGVPLRASHPRLLDGRRRSAAGTCGRGQSAHVVGKRRAAPRRNVRGGP